MPDGAVAPRDAADLAGLEPCDGFLRRCQGALIYLGERFIAHPLVRPFHVAQPHHSMRRIPTPYVPLCGRLVKGLFVGHKL